MKKNVLGIVCPCYNEEEVLRDSNNKLQSLIKEMSKEGLISKESFIVYVNDGSNDNTWEIIKELYKNNKNVCGLNFASNRGHQNALYAGYMYVKDRADMAISIDVDLQDDLNALKQMVIKYTEGYDIVFGVKVDRSADSFLKKFTAETYYKVLNIFGSNAIKNHADFRLLSKLALEELSLYSENHLFLRGITRDLGLRWTTVDDVLKPREKGESKYTLSKMLNLAFNGITSFSIKPLTLIFYLGIVSILVSICFVIYTVVIHYMGMTVWGWSSMFASIWFLGGVQLVSLGVIGQYVGNTFIESKKRPRYFISESLEHPKKKN